MVFEVLFDVPVCNSNKMGLHLTETFGIFKSSYRKAGAPYVVRPARPRSYLDFEK